MQIAQTLMCGVCTDNGQMFRLIADVVRQLYYFPYIYLPQAFGSIFQCTVYKCLFEVNICWPFGLEWNLVCYLRVYLPSNNSE